ncbi:hypothetical protein [Actinoplanes sp. GCM10030250]|uniref:hypothetical protein n=1 Tax=Actinoplanes sp. GCM10030250 TaxID=3273376 RepID=UPI00360B387A
MTRFVPLSFPQAGTGDRIVATIPPPGRVVSHVDPQPTADSDTGRPMLPSAG